MLVAKQKFSTATLNFLPVGHTHEDIDLLWAVVMARVLHKANIQTPDEFADAIEEGMSDFCSAKGEECKAVVLERVRDFQLWLKPLGIHVHNCFMPRLSISPPHSFAFKCRSSLTDAETNTLHPACNRGHRVDDLDVFCVVKGRMHHTNPNGPPVLVVPRQRFEWMDAPEPRHWEPVDTFDEKRINDLYNLANVLENMTADWSSKFSYFRAALAVRTLAVRVGNPPPPLLGSWVAAPSAHRPPVQDSGNVYFGHLPNMTWRMLVTFRRRAV